MPKSPNTSRARSTGRSAATPATACAPEAATPGRAREDRLVLDLAGFGLPEAPLLGRSRALTAQGGLRPHRHGGCWEICYLAEGRQVFAVGGEVCVLRGGDLFVTRPGELHDTAGHVREPGRLDWLQIRLPAGRRVLGLDRATTQTLRAALLALPERHGRATDAVRAAFAEAFDIATAEDDGAGAVPMNLATIKQTGTADEPRQPRQPRGVGAADPAGERRDRKDQRERRERRAGRQADGPATGAVEATVEAAAGLRRLRLGAALVRLLLGVIASLGERRAPTPPDPIARAVAYIHAHPERPLRIAEMARVAALSPSWFQAAFRKALGMSPGEYALRTRIEAARARLLGSESITAIAHDLGFGSSQYFATVFRKYHGISPGAWRKAATPPSGPADAEA